MVAAADATINPGATSDPDFFSPGWAPLKYTSPFADPSFFNSNWSGKSVYKSLSDPDFLSTSWRVPTYTSTNYPGFQYSNWSVKTPVLFRYSQIEPSRTNNFKLDPFASDDELRGQGWQVTNNLW
ncbi:MAG: hypothetical protein WCJ93_08990 [Methanomicrobiales archaeon]